MKPQNDHACMANEKTDRPTDRPTDDDDPGVGFERAFPKLDLRLLTLAINFYFPFTREVLMALGGVMGGVCFSRSFSPFAPFAPFAPFTPFTAFTPQTHHDVSFKSPVLLYSPYKHFLSAIQRCVTSFVCYGPSLTHTRMSRLNRIQTNMFMWVCVYM